MNLSKADRIVRVVGAIGFFVAAALAPVPFAAQLALGATGLYVLGTSLVGTCLGYKLIGASTCPVPTKT